MPSSRGLARPSHGDCLMNIQFTNYTNQSRQHHCTIRRIILHFPMRIMRWSSFVTRNKRLHESLNVELENYFYDASQSSMFTNPFNIRR